MLSFNLTIVIQMVSFLVFAWLFNLVFFKPIVAHIEARNRYLADQQVKAVELANAAQELRAEHARRLREAQREAQAGVEAAIREAQAAQARQLEAVQREGRTLIEQARGQLDTERLALVTDLQDEVGGIAKTIADKVLSFGARAQGALSGQGVQA